MKKFLTILLVLAAMVAQAQTLNYKGKFTLNVELDGAEKQFASYNIYLSDKYFHTPKQATTSVPVKDGKFTYEVEVDYMKGLCLKGVDAQGKEQAGCGVEVYAVPNVTYDVKIADGQLTPTKSQSDQYPWLSKVERYSWDARRATKWTSPYLPKPTGLRWSEVEQKCDTFYRMSVKEVWLGQKETVVRLMSEACDARRGAGKDDYLLDENGKQYKMVRTLLGNPGEDNSAEVGVYGGYYAFEPLPQTVKSFTYVSGTCKVSEVRKAAKKPVKKPAPNFKVTIHPTNGIFDTGYLLYMYDKYGRPNNQLGILKDVPCDENREVYFETYIEEPTEFYMLATFADGSICPTGIKIPAFPGHAIVNVMDGTYDLTGDEGFYKEMQDAIDFVDNTWESDKDSDEKNKQIRRYLLNHANEQGTLYGFYFRYLLSIDQMYDVLNDKQLDTPVGRQIMERYKAYEEQVKKAKESAKNSSINTRNTTSYNVLNSFVTSPPVAINTRNTTSYNSVPKRHSLSYKTNETRETVDLGLPSGTLWATCNVGTTSPEYGRNYMSWEKAIKHVAEYWGNGWQLPTKEQFAELINPEYTTTEWTSVKGQMGRKITSKKNGRSIFLPAAGWVGDDNKQQYLNESGSYWSCEESAEDANKAYGLSFYHSDIYTNDDRKVLHRTARAVRMPNTNVVDAKPGKTAKNAKAITIKDITLNMIPVKGGNYSKIGNFAIMQKYIVFVNDFQMSDSEVTQELWEAVMGYNPSYTVGSQLPVENVTWEECQEFLKKLKDITGQDFRLPTEAEWEWAAMGGLQNKGYLFSGSNNCDEVAWNANNSGKMPHPVKTLKPNELGIYDMNGNVYEWTSSEYHEDAPPCSEGTVENNHSRHVYRGGDFGCKVEENYVTQRGYFDARRCSKNIGLRLVITTASDIQGKEKKDTGKKNKNHVETNRLKAVDLGLSVKWASMNVGATKPEGTGMYFNWGDVNVPVSSNQSWYSYRLCNRSERSLTKYNTDVAYGSNVDMRTMLLPEDDAATQIMGDTWRTPTIAEINELMEKCKWEWTTLNGVNGHLVTGKNGNSIFLPAAGCLNYQGVYGLGSDGYYWSSEIDPQKPTTSFYLHNYTPITVAGFHDRFAARTIRAVESKNK